MSDDLISRKFLLECAEYDNNGRLIVPYRYVKNAPTAFDKEKVLKNLREELKLSEIEKERCSIENPLQFDSAKGYANGVGFSIAVVEGGGLN